MTVPVSYGNVITEVQMQQDEIDYMVSMIQSLPENGKMVEWGCGGSTCKWLDNLKPTQKLFTIEHNEGWYNRVNRAVKNHFGTLENFEFVHIPEQHGLEHGYASIIEEHPFGCKDYINPSDKIWDSDIFFIDGIARAACAMTVLLKSTKPDAAIYIHDHAGREIWYEWATQFYRLEPIGTTLVRLHKE